jgi:hypothetical protein
MLAFADPSTTVRIDVSIDEPIGSASDTGGFTALRGTLSGYLETVQ